MLFSKFHHNIPAGILMGFSSLQVFNSTEQGHRTTPNLLMSDRHLRVNGVSFHGNRAMDNGIQLQTLFQDQIFSTGLKDSDSVSRKVYNESPNSEVNGSSSNCYLEPSLKQQDGF